MNVLDQCVTIPSDNLFDAGATCERLRLRPLRVMHKPNMKSSTSTHRFYITLNGRSEMINGTLDSLIVFANRDDALMFKLAHGGDA